MSENILIDRDCLQALVNAALGRSAPGEDIAPHLSAAQILLAQPPGLRPPPTIDERREFFETACKASKDYKFPLGVFLINGRFSHYHDSDTDSAFAGYRAGFMHGCRWERGIAVITPPAAAPSEVQAQ